MESRIEPTVGELTPLLVTQATMAKLLSVSMRWLRDSGCPVVRLPSSRPQGRPMLRYDVDRAREWFRGFGDGKIAA